ncbi:MAG: VWA domain-containing protein, partial [Planctomycetota bacterium]
MSFLQPAMLWFAGLASVPVLIYLFHRQRYTVLPWAAMAFVRRALHRNRRRMKIENWLLLALRVLAVLLLVAAVARPVLRSRALAGDTEGGVRNVVIALDTSFSMAQRHGARTAFDRAREGAQQLAAHRVREGDRVALVRLGADAEPVYAEPFSVNEQERARLIADIAAQRPSYRPGDMPRALRGLLALLPRFRGEEDGSPPPAEIYVFTDLQRSSWRGADGRWLDPDLPATVEALRRADARVTLIDCGAPERANAAITDLGLEEPVAVLDAPLRFFVELWAAGAQPLE